MADPLPEGFELVQTPEAPAPQFTDIGQAKTVADIDANPEAAAKSLSLSKQTNLPFDVVAADPAGAERDNKLSVNTGVIQNNPSLSGFIAEHPAASQVSNDDYANLDLVSKAIKAFGSGYNAGYAGTLSDIGAAGSMLGFGKEPNAPPAPPEAPGIFSAVQGVGNTAGGLIGLVNASMPETAAGGALGLLGGPFAEVTVPGGALAGLAYGFAINMAAATAGSVYRNLSSAVDTNGSKISEPVKYGAAILSAIPSFFLGRMGAAIAPEIAGGIRSLVGETVTKAATNPTTAVMIGRVVTQLGRAGLEGAAINGAFQASSEVAQDLAKELSTGDWKTALNDPATREAISDRIWQSMAEGAALVSVLHVPGIGFNAVKDTLAVRAAKQGQVALDKVIEASAASKTKTRSPDTFADFLEHENPGQTLHVPADAIDALYAGAEPKPGDGKLGFVTDLATQLAVARDTGGDVTIPVSQYIANVDDATHAKLSDHIRVTADGLTPKEADELSETPDEEEPAEASKAVEGTALKPGEETILEVPPIAAATSAVAAAEYKGMALHQLFENADAMGADEREYNLYLDKIGAVQRASDEKAMALAEIEAKRRLKPEWEEAAKRTAEEAANDLRYRPDIIADTLLRTGKLPNEQVVPEDRVRLNPEDVDEATGVQGSYTKLPRNMLSERGIHPDELNDYLNTLGSGFGSGKELVEALTALNAARGERTPAAHFSDLVAQETNARMEQTYGNLGDHINEAAKEAALANPLIDVLHDEMKYIGRQAGVNLPFSVDQLFDFTQKVFDETELAAASKLEKYQAQTGRAGRKAELALLKGKVVDAFKAKQQQFLSFLLAQKAHQLRKELKSFQRLAKQYASNETLPKVAQEYVDHIQSLLGRFGLDLRRNQADLQSALSGGRTLSQFVDDKLVDEGRDIPLAPFLADPTFTKHFSELTVQEFRALRDTIRSLDYHGRDEKKILIEGKKLELAQQVQAATKSLFSLNRRRRMPRNPGISQRIRSLGAHFNASMLRMEQMIDWFDAWDPSGPFNQVLRGVIDGRNRRDAMLKELGRKLREIGGDAKWQRSLNAQISNNTLTDWVTGEPIQLRRKDLVAIMLHMGNASNLEKLTGEFTTPEGRTIQWKEQDVWNLVNANARKEDWDFVQRIWNLYGEYWPQIEKHTRDVSGVAPDKIEPLPIHNQFGDYPGGYFPLKTDPRWIGKGGYRPGAFGEQTFYSAVPKKNYTKSRTGAVYPLDLNFDVIPETLKQTIHDLAMRRSLIEAKKFFDNDAVRSAIQRVFGHEYLAQVDPWLQYVAASKMVDDHTLAGINMIARTMRRRLVAVQMLYRASTALKHGAAALADSAGEVGPLNLAAEMVKIYGNGFTAPAKVKAIIAHSPELQNRIHSTERDYREAMERAIGGNGIYANTLHWGGIATGTLDMGSAIPTWSVAYHRSILAGKDETTAVAEADKAVRNAHGSGAITDLPAIMRNNEAMKLLTIAYTFFNHNYNRIADAGRMAAEGAGDLANGKYGEAFGKFQKAALRTFWYLGAVALAEGGVQSIIYPRENGDGPDWGVWAAEKIGLQLASTIPGIRDIASSLEYHGFKHVSARDLAASSPIGAIGAALLDSALDIKKYLEDGEPSNRWLRDSLETAGYVFALPGMGQAGVTGQFLWDWAEGKQEPANVGEVLRGIAFGKVKQ